MFVYKASLFEILEEPKRRKNLKIVRTSDHLILLVLI